MKYMIGWIFWNLMFSNFIIAFFPDNPIKFLLGMGMPAVSAILFLKFEKLAIAPGVNWRVGNFKSYVLALLAPVAVAILTITFGFISGHLSVNSNHRLSLISSVLTLLIWLGSSLGEEIGWRGYLHNHLKRVTHAPLWIGLIWGVWHYRDLFARKAGMGEILLFTLLTVFISYFLSWIIESGGGVIACGLFHGVWNFLRLKVLFGNPAHGTQGYFLTTDASLTEMEGLFGVIACSLVLGPAIYVWYQRKRAVVT